MRAAYYDYSMIDSFVGILIQMNKKTKRIYFVKNVFLFRHEKKSMAQ